MTQFRSILITSISFTVIAAVMWGLAIDWTAGHKLATAMPLDRSGAITASVLAGIWWSVLLVLRHLGNKALLIRTLADAAPVQPAARKTLPLPRLRVL